MAGKVLSLGECAVSGALVSRTVKRLIFLIALIARLIFFNRALIAVITHILFVTFFNLFVFHLQVDVVGPLLLTLVYF